MVAIIKRALLLASVVAAVSCASFGQNQLTPRQRRIEQERQRLSSVDVEERRDALMKLGIMNHPDAARAAAAALNDPDPMIRVTAAHAISALPGPEAVALLTPLTTDKLEFVRREGAFALGETHSRFAVQTLSGLLADKEAGVRAAAIMALGKIGDESAIPALAGLLTSPTKKKREDEFVLRAAADALGEIRSRAGTAALISTLGNEDSPLDVRRAAAKSLGMIGDPSAKPVLQAAYASSDPYLSEAAREALRRLRLAGY